MLMVRCLFIASPTGMISWSATPMIDIVPALATLSTARCSAKFSYDERGHYQDLVHRTQPGIRHKPHLTSR